VEKVYLDGVANLSATVKDHIIRSYNYSQNLAQELMLVNISFLAQSSLFTSIRQLQFSLMKLTQQLDELMNAVQLAMLGKVPISLVSHNLLLNVLKNLTLQLAGSCEIAYGIRDQDMSLYYELVKVSDGRYA
jgi:hypothetical protein